MTTATPNPAPPPIYPISYHALSSTISRWVPLRAIDIHALRNLGMFDNGKPIYHLLNHPIKWVRVTGVVVAVDEFGERRILTVDDSSGSCIECVCAIPPAASTSASATITVPEHLNQNPFQVKIKYTKDAQVACKSGLDLKAKGSRKLGTKDVEKGCGSKGKQQPSAQNPLVPWDDLDVGSVLKIKGQITTFRDMKQVDVIKIDIIRGTDAEVKCWDEVYTFRQTVLSKVWFVSAEEGKSCEEKASTDAKKSKERERRGQSKSREEGKGVKKDDGRDGGASKAHRKSVETEEERRHRHEVKKRQKGKEKLTEGLNPSSRISNSMAGRRRVARKYDKLGV